MYKTILEFKKSIKSHSSAVIIINELNQCLILQRGSKAPWMPNKWNLPGGGVDNNETYIDAAIRECYEETNLIVSNLKFVSSNEHTDYIIHFFVSKDYNGEFKLNWENSNYKWITKNEIINYEFVPDVKEILYKIL